MSGSSHAEPPRVGILHLLVLTACVAVCLGISRTFSLSLVEYGVTRPLGPFEAATGTLYGIGSGAALSGVILFAARRWRGATFPVHPGEYLLVVMGLGTALYYGALALLLSLNHRRPYERTDYSVLLLFLLLVLYGAIILWALIRVRIRRWRVFFATMLAGVLLSGFLICGGVYSGQIVFRVVPALVLIVVVLKDRAQANRYPWTHWLGVGTKLWLDATAAGDWACWAFFRGLPS